MKKIEIGTFAATLIAAGAALAGDVESWANETFSPDGKNEIRFYANPLAYEVVRDGVTVVAKSEIGLTVDGARLGGTDATERVPPVITTGKRSGVVDAPVYKKSKVDLSANEAFVDFGAWGVRLVARNDGVAYRFETKKSGKMRVDAEKASLHLPSADVKCWGYRTRAFGEEESVPFAFMAKIPTVWKNTVGLAGTPDTMFVAARETRDGAWYVGGITIAEARDCTLATSFLGAGEWTILG